MTQLPGSDWWNSVQFTTGQTQPGSPGFSMSRDDMMELFKLARSMQDQINEQFREQQAMVQVSAPANDPGSHIYLGRQEDQDDRSFRKIGDAYTKRLQTQAEYLGRLVSKLYAALQTVESKDYESADGAYNVNRLI